MEEKIALATKARLKELGLHIRLTRRSLNISRQKIADRLGMHISNVARIEQGRQNLTVDTLLRVSVALGVKLVIRLETDS